MQDSFFLLVVWAGESSLLAYESGRAEYKAGKVWRIGYLSHVSGIGPLEEAFRQSLRQLGYIEGQNLVIEWYAGLMGWPVPHIFGRSKESIDALQPAERATHEG